jgi:hypothetical protein
LSGETETNISGWTIDTLREHVRQQFADLRHLLDERYATQTKALEAAFQAAEQAVQTALLSQEKAVNKAEIAADKRFESVNEFRQQLADQAGLFFTRTEADARLGALTDKLDASTGRNAERIQALERIVERDSGHDAGSAARGDSVRLNVGQVIAAVGVLLVAVSVVLAIIATR